MKDYTAEERKALYEKIQRYCTDQEALKISLIDNLVVKYGAKKVEEKNKYCKINEYFFKIDEVINYTILNKENIPNIQNIIFACINAITEYEHFKSLNIDKDTYNQTELHKQLEDNLKYYNSDTIIKIKTPQHPNDIVRGLYIELMGKCNLHKYTVKKITKILFKDIRKITYTKNTQNQINKIMDTLKEVIDYSEKGTKEERKQVLTDLQELEKILLKKHR